MGTVGRLLVITAVAAQALLTRAAVAAPQQEPQIAFESETCRPGSAVTIRGIGFAPGDAIELEVLPPLVRLSPGLISGSSGTLPLSRTVAGEDGSFRQTFTLDIPPGPPDRPGYVVMRAFAASFGPPSAMTSALAPRAMCIVPVGFGLPATGVGCASTRKSVNVSIAIIAVECCLALVIYARRRRDRFSDDNFGPPPPRG